MLILKYINIFNRETFAKYLGLILISINLLAVGCANISGSDPWESFNRPIHSLNEVIDSNALKPTAEVYRTITPNFFRQGVNNFFDNLDEPYSAINNLLQLRFAEAGRNIGKFFINSTIGLFGLFDVAATMDVVSTKEDFGQTLGAWGVGTGGYLVLPFFGSTNVRDSFTGFLVDWRYNLLSRKFRGNGNGVYAVQLFHAIRLRESFLDIEKSSSGLALDKYVFYKSVFTQLRSSQVFNGKVPEEIEDDSWLDEN